MLLLLINITFLQFLSSATSYVRSYVIVCVHFYIFLVFVTITFNHSFQYMRNHNYVVKLQLKILL